MHPPVHDDRLNRMLGLLERLDQGAAGILAGLQVGVGAQAPSYQHQILVVPETVVQPPQVPAPVLSRHASALISGEPERIRKFVRGLPPTIRSYVFRSSREGASFQTIVSAAREAELLERDDFGGPKRVRTGGQYSGTSSGGRGPHRGGGSFQRQRPVHASLLAIEGGPAAWGPPGYEVDVETLLDISVDYELCSIGCWFAVRMKFWWFGWD
ncbi:hypothetical protein H5410_031063 [Solanum commersonii]|uniref:Uncharacterized protein n=1 Tax=Solanum commersonii TaxID=4109 RepID=A0A9J5YI16_SOLCO|nr:hypothetical protein H5410_031063 [Solanum commersonii]